MKIELRLLILIASSLSRVVLTALSLSRRPCRVALITVLIASPLLLPILLPSLLNPPNPADPSNYIESFVTATGRTTRRGVVAMH